MKVLSNLSSADTPVGKLYTSTRKWWHVWKTVSGKVLELSKVYEGWQTWKSNLFSSCSLPGLSLCLHLSLHICTMGRIVPISQDSSMWSQCYYWYLALGLTTTVILPRNKVDTNSTCCEEVRTLRHWKGCTKIGQLTTALITHSK